MLGVVLVVYAYRSKRRLGHPFYSGTTAFPRYCRSFTPISLDQNPEAVRSRKLLKKVTPGCISGLARAG